MYFDTADAAGPSHCARWRCGQKEPGIVWPRKTDNKQIQSDAEQSRLEDIADLRDANAAGIIP